MVKFWINFIKNSDPSETPGEWHKFDSKNSTLNREIMFLNGSYYQNFNFQLNDSFYKFWTSSESVSLKPNFYTLFFILAVFFKIFF